MKPSTFDFRGAKKMRLVETAVVVLVISFLLPLLLLLLLGVERLFLE